MLRVLGGFRVIKREKERKKKGKLFLEYRNVVEGEDALAISGSGSLETTPALLEAAAGHVASPVCHGAGAGIRGRAGGGVLASQTGGDAAVIAVHGVAGSAAADVVDGGGLAHVPFELFVEAEDGALTAAVDVAGTAAA